MENKRNCVLCYAWRFIIINQCWMLPATVGLRPDYRAHSLWWYWTCTKCEVRTRHFFKHFFCRGVCRFLLSAYSDYVFKNSYCTWESICQPGVGPTTTTLRLRNKNCSWTHCVILFFVYLIQRRFRESIAFSSTIGTSVFTPKCTHSWLSFIFRVFCGYLSLITVCDSKGSVSDFLSRHSMNKATVSLELGSFLSNPTHLIIPSFLIMSPSVVVIVLL